MKAILLAAFSMLFPVLSARRARRCVDEWQWWQDYLRLGADLGRRVRRMDEAQKAGITRPPPPELYW